MIWLVSKRYTPSSVTNQVITSFFQTKVEQIAKLSRVSPATVYAQCGGKQGLLRQPEAAQFPVERTARLPGFADVAALPGDGPAADDGQFVHCGTPSSFGPDQPSGTQDSRRGML